jgi:hypothetical protein
MLRKINKLVLNNNKFGIIIFNCSTSGVIFLESMCRVGIVYMACNRWIIDLVIIKMLII